MNINIQQSKFQSNIKIILNCSRINFSDYRNLLFYRQRTTNISKRSQDGTLIISKNIENANRANYDREKIQQFQMRAGYPQSQSIILLKRVYLEIREKYSVHSI